MLIAFLWLSFEHLFLGSASVILAADNTELLIPGFISPAFSGMENPLWDNFTTAGVDRMANGHFTWVDIFLFSHLPGWLAHGLRIASQYGFALLGVYWLCRRTFTFGAGAALFVAFAYSATLTPYLFHSVFAYLPMVLLTLSLVLERKEDIGRWVLLGVFVFVIAHTSYFSRLIPNASAMIFVWFLFVETKKTVKDWAIILAVCFIIVGLRAGEILAIMALSPESHMPLVRFQTPLSKIIEGTLWPTVFFGTWKNTVFSLLFLFALVARRGGDGRMKGVLLLALFSGLILVPAVVALQIVLIPYLPFLYGYRLEFLNFISGAVLVFSSGYGIQVLVDKVSGSKPSSLTLWSGRAALVMAVGVVMYGSVKMKYTEALNWITHGSYARNFESPILKSLADEIKAQPWPQRAELFQIYPAYLHAYGIETAGGYIPINYLRYYEFWGEMNAPRMAKLRPGTQDYNMYIKRQRQVREGPKFRGDRLMLMPEDYRPEWKLNDLYRLKFLSLANVGHLVSRDRLTDPSLEPIREPDAPWSSLSTRGRTAVNVKANFRGLEHLYVYKNKNAFPRFFTVSALKPFKTGREVLDGMAAASLETLRTTAFVEQSKLPKDFSLNQRFARADIKLDRYISDEIKLTVKADGKAVLIVTNSFSPFWTAEVDGAQTPIFPAYHAFWGIALPQGAKSVTFRFDPPYRQKLKILPW